MMSDHFINLQEQNFSFLGRGLKLKGEFHLSGIVKIASEIEGTLYIQSPGKITIERNGQITGTIYCHDLEIFGLFEGTIEAEGQVILQPSAQVSGKINTQNITIYPGAIVNIDGNTEN